MSNAHEDCTKLTVVGRELGGNNWAEDRLQRRQHTQKGRKKIRDFRHSNEKQSGNIGKNSWGKKEGEREDIERIGL